MLPVHSKLLKKLKAGDTDERCGVILTSGKIVTTRNLATETTRAFEIPAEDMIQPGVIGTWHTHPSGIANLSTEDYAGFLNWPTLTHYVIGIDGVRGYVVQDGMVINQ